MKDFAYYSTSNGVLVRKSKTGMSIYALLKLRRFVEQNDGVQPDN